MASYRAQQGSAGSHDSAPGNDEAPQAINRNCGISNVPENSFARMSIADADASNVDGDVILQQLDVIMAETFQGSRVAVPAFENQNQETSKTLAGVGSSCASDLTTTENGDHAQ